MKYPGIKDGREKELFVNGFDGYRPTDTVTTRILSKLSALENVWCRDKTVSVRPGLTAQTAPETSENGVTAETFFDRAYKNTGVIKKVCGRAWHGSENALGAVLFCDGEDMQKEIKTSLALPDGADSFRVDKFLALTAPTLTDGAGVFLIFSLCFLDGEREVSKACRIYEISADTGALSAVGNEKFYKPYVRINVKCENYVQAMLVNDFDFPFANESSPEGENLFGGGFRVAYVSDGLTSTFALPYKNLTSCPGETVTLEMRTGYYGGVRWEIPYNASVSNAVTYEGKQIRAHLDRAAGTVTIKDTSGNNTVFLPTSVPNMVVITAYKSDESRLAEFINGVCDHAECAERLFMTGGNNVYYSGKNQSFYFTEKEKITVGDAQTPVTALAFQNRYLVVFKTAGTYRVSVTGNPDNDYGTLLGSTKNVTLPKMKYTLTMVHSSVGCTCPDTVALCSNHLVWLDGDKNVYTLMGTNLYTEGNVYEISANIKPHLKRINITKDTFGEACDGYYFLFSENEVFVLDGNIGGFRYMSGEHRNASGDGAEWYYWRFDPAVHVREMFMTSEKCVLTVDSGDGVYRAVLDGGEDGFYTSDGLVKRPISWFFESGDIMLSRGGPVTVYEMRFDIKNKDRVSLTVCDDKGTKLCRTLEYHDGDMPIRVSCDTPFYFACGIRFRMCGEGETLLHCVSVRYKTR